MFTKSTASWIVLAIGSAVVAAVVQDPQSMQKDESQFMKRKLEAAREIVGGLATEDYDKISKSAQDLMLLSHEVEWNVFQTPRYIDMSSEFRKSAERLRNNAREKNLDGATIANFEVTLNCVRCHKYIRGNRVLQKE